jgi:4-alpha-glucanotransferase
VVGESEQANLPGTIDEHPNWRRRLSRTIENIIDRSELRRTASIVEEARQRSAQA